jgi:hypothetical protein
MVKKLDGYDSILDKLNAHDTSLADIATNVKNHGATGGSDDSVAFQAANDYLVAHGGGVLYVPAGTWYANFIHDSNVYIKGAGAKVTVIKSVSGSNKDVVQGRNFLTLTGTAKQTPENRGVRFCGISDITIDGNRTNNTSGYGIREWGCSWYWKNVVIQNCVNDGVWTEFTDIEFPSGSTSYEQALECTYVNIKCINNGNNGWTYNGPHDGNLINFVAFNNGGYALKQGLQTSSLTGSNWNSWLNGNSFYIGTNLTVDKLIASGNVGNSGIGIEFASTGGGSKLTDVTVDGNTTGIILRGSNVKIDGSFGQNTNDAVVLDGCYGCLINIVGNGNGNVFKINSEASANFVTALMDIPVGKTVVNGVFANSDVINIMTTGGVVYTKCQLPSSTLHSPNGWNPVLPQSDGIIATWIQGSGAPTGIPTQIGVEYLDTTNKKLYKAFGITSASDWVVMN